MKETRRLNGIMMKILDRYKNDVQRIDDNFSPDLLQVLNSGFVVWEGCIFLKKQFELSKGIKSIKFIDKTDIECYVNHMHIEDYIEGQIELSRVALLKEALSFVSRLKSELSKRYPNFSFKVIVACRDESSSVRFHKLRKNESWLADNLDLYSSEAVLEYQLEPDVLNC
jgi:hypothetical protein